MDTKTFGKITWSVFGLAGFAAIAYGAIWLYNPDMLGSDPLDNLEAEEAGRMRQILSYCGRGTRDARTCLLWVNSYKELLTGEAHQVALFDKDSQDRIDQMKRRRGLEAEAEAATVPGKSPAEELPPNQ